MKGNKVSKKKYDVSLYRHEIDRESLKKFGFPTRNDKERIAFALKYAKEYVKETK